jgi:tetratricopeptide (TPR) repeat protein
MNKPIVAICLCALLASCRSSKPPPPVSDLRQSAQLDMDSGHAAYERRNWPSAASAFSRAADKYAAMDDDASRATALVNQGNAVLGSGQPWGAEEIFERAFTLADRAGSKRTAASALAGRARCWPGDATKACVSLDQALSLVRDDPATTATLQNELAVVRMQMQLTGVTDLLQAALATNEKLGRTRDTAVNRLNLGRYYLAQPEYNLARQHLDTALEQFRKLDDPVGLAQAHESLMKLHEATGHAEQAAFHRDRALQTYQFLKDQAGVKRLDGEAK